MIRVSPVSAATAVRRAGPAQGFTLIELLIVISIITLLIGILLPALGKARDTAKALNCLSNSRQMGLAMNIYATDWNNMLPNNGGLRWGMQAAENQEYPVGWGYQNISRTNFPDAQGEGPFEGYVHWSGALIAGKYLTDGKAMWCPQAATQGWAPTYFDATYTKGNPVDIEGYQQISDNEGPGTINGAAGTIFQALGVIGNPLQVDTQARRLSYCANEAIIPQGQTLAEFTGSIINGTGSNATLVKTDRIDKASGTIMIAEYTDYMRQLFDFAPSTGNGIQSHRPTHAVYPVDVNGNPILGGRRWDGENLRYDSTTGLPTSTMTGVAYAKALSVNDGWSIFNTFKTYPVGTAWTSNVNSNPVPLNPTTGLSFTLQPGQTPYLAYISPDRHNGKANYTFVDTHAEALTLDQTLDPMDWKWGLKMYANPEFQVLQPGNMLNGNGVLTNVTNPVQ